VSLSTNTVKLQLMATLVTKPPCQYGCLNNKKRALMSNLPFLFLNQHQINTH